MIDPGAVRAVAERLIAIPSVSPDPVAETRCARALIECLPADLEHGEWATPDGRPIVWALLRGSSPRTVVLLGHYDTVGVADYAALDPARALDLAFDPEAVRSRLTARLSAGGSLPSQLVADLEEESRRPGTWMFGRGSLDMKSGLAAAIGALDALQSAAPAGNVLFVATPDEEHESAGMLAAVPELERFRSERGLDPIGALNLDYGLEPAVHVGAVGKLEVGCYALGHSGHVGDPGRGPDAIQMIAAVVSHVTRATERVGDGDSGVPPAALSMRDLKTAYSIEAANEAVVEFSVITHGRSVEHTLEMLGAAAGEALAELGSGPRSGGAGATPHHERIGTRPATMTYAELMRRTGAGSPPAIDALDARGATIERVRSACRTAAIEPPALVIYLLPPFYPFAAPGTGPLVEAARRVGGEEQIPVRSLYPFISDVSYLSWRESEVELAHQFPALGHEYRLPFAASRALDLEVVNLGPWGRDAHTRYERVHAPFAFERLPGLIERVVRDGLTRR